PPDLYTLSLHDALPIWVTKPTSARSPSPGRTTRRRSASTRDSHVRWGHALWPGLPTRPHVLTCAVAGSGDPATRSDRWSPLRTRSEEHTSELQSRGHLV